MKTTISLKELLDCEFTANEDGKIVAELSLERINLIADILTNQKDKIDKAIEYIKNASYFDGSSMCANDLLKILGDGNNE